MVAPNATFEQIQAPDVSVQTEPQEAVAAPPENAGNMEITRYEGGMPILRWKSNNQPPINFMTKYMGEDTFTGMALGSLALMALKLTGFIVAGAAGATAALPFGATMMTAILGGAAIGGLFNSRRVAAQQRDGYEFTPPSSINAGTARGLMHGVVMGAGMTMLAGVLLKTVVGSAVTGVGGFLAQAAAVMAPSAMGATGLAALSMFALPAMMAVGVGLYMAHKLGKQHEQMKQLEYQHAVQIFRVQEGHIQGHAPVKELEEHLEQTRNRNYAPEAATVAGVAVGAAALSALGAHVPHDISHTTSHAAEESLNHAIAHAGHHTSNNSTALTSEGSNFAARFTNNASNMGKTFADRVGNTSAQAADTGFADKITAARQAHPIPSAATLG